MAYCTFYRELIGCPVHYKGGRFAGMRTSIRFRLGLLVGGYGIILARLIRDSLPESIPMSYARGGQRCLQVFEGVCEGLRERELRGGVGPKKLLVLKKVG